MAFERAALQRISEIRLAEAKLLAGASQPGGAYYLAGYAIECALKARIASRFREGEIPDRALVNSIYTHELTALLRLAGLESELEDAIEINIELGQRWAIVKKWSEQARYAIWTDDDASSMIDAIEGMLAWLTKR
jgi:hypothetical protein